MTVSIVLAAHDAGRSIARCLEALSRQAGIERAEVIVASSSTDDTDAIVARYPFVHLLRFADRLNVPELRARAIAATKGEIIAVLDPYSIAEERWLAELVRAHEERPELVIGGPVDLADAGSRTLLEWAQYINEYGMFLPPMASGRMEILPGSNVSYKRPALFDGDAPRHATFWKTFVNREAAGSGLWLAASAVVALDKPIPFSDFLRTRYHHGRCFAGMRHAGTAERLARALSAPLLPLVFLWRVGRAYLGRGRHRSKLWATLPLQALLFGVWAGGEMAGYLFGRGRSCGKLFY